MKFIRNTLLFFLILFLPVLIFCLCIYFYYPKDIQNGKLILATKYPSLKKVFSLRTTENKNENEDNAREESRTQIEQEKGETPFNQEFYSALCLKEDKKSSITPFVGCDSCPTYLDVENREQKLIYKYFYRGHFTNPNEEEASFFFTGCNSKNSEKMDIVVLRKTLGQWKQYKTFQIDTHEKKPLFFQKKDSTASFVAKTTEIIGPKINEDIVLFKLTENGLQTRNLFNAQYSKGIQCANNLGTTVSEPITTKTGFSFDMDFIAQFKSDTLCETVTESQRKLDLEPNKYTLNFEYKNDSLQPDDKTLFILNKLDKSIESNP